MLEELLTPISVLMEAVEGVPVGTLAGQIPFPYLIVTQWGSPFNQDTPRHCSVYLAFSFALYVIRTLLRVYTCRGFCHTKMSSDLLIDLPNLEHEPWPEMQSLRSQFDKRSTVVVTGDIGRR